MRMVSTKAAGYSKEEEMLGDSLRDIPRTRHASRKGDKVALAKGRRLAAVGGSDGHFSSQQVAGLGLIIGPRKLGNTAAPSAPAKDALLLEKVLVRLRDDFDFGAGGSFGRHGEGGRRKKRWRGLHKAGDGGDQEKEKRKQRSQHRHGRERYGAEVRPRRRAVAIFDRSTP